MVEIIHVLFRLFSSTSQYRFTSSVSQYSNEILRPLIDFDPIADNVTKKWFLSDHYHCCRIRSLRWRTSIDIKLLELRIIYTYVYCGIGKTWIDSLFNGLFIRWCCIDEMLQDVDHPIVKVSNKSSLRTIDKWCDLCWVERISMMNYRSKKTCTNLLLLQYS